MVTNIQKKKRPLRLIVEVLRRGMMISCHKKQQAVNGFFFAGAKASTQTKDAYLVAKQFSVRFDLYMLFNPDSPHGYPYVALNPQSPRIINIHDSHVRIMDKADTLFYETDYLPTNRFIDIDMDRLDLLVNTYTGQQEYNIITRFIEEKHITLTYHSPTNEGPKDYDIFTGYPEQRARKLVEDLFPMMLAVRDAVYAE